MNNFLNQLNALGKRVTANEWLKSYLQGQSQKVFITSVGENFNTESKQLTIGVPQGMIY